MQQVVDDDDRYHNEADTGKAISSFLSGKANSAQLTRKDIWYTSKLGMQAVSATLKYYGIVRHN